MIGRWALEKEGLKPDLVVGSSSGAIVGVLYALGVPVETIERYGALDAPWGRFRRFAIGSTDLPGNGADGSLGAFRVMRYGPAAQPVQNANFGDTFVAIVEIGNPVTARVLTTYGNSSQLGSPHGEDQLRLLAAKQLRPALLDRREIAANLESRDSF